MHKKIFAILLLAFCAPAFAWDDVGHKTTAYIAWQVMSPKAKEKAIKILLSAPEDSNLSVFFSNYDARPIEIRKLEFFMTAAIWSDIVRDRNFSQRYQKYHKPNWHYFDKFWKIENGALKIIEKTETTDGGKAVEKLYEFEETLRSSTVSDSEKAIALAWFLHLAGDIHQPLHNSARITEEEPNGDQGGNLFLLTPKDTPREKQENLHWFWDSIIIRNIPRGEDCDIVFIRNLAKSLIKKYPLEQMRNSLKLGEYKEWHEETFQIAVNEVFPVTLKRFEMPSEEYRKKAFEISEKQITLAGYRIGMTLNEIFDK